MGPKTLTWRFMSIKIYDSRDFSFCDLCGEVVVGNTAQVVEANGLLRKISDLQIAHLQCWMNTFGPEATYSAS